MKKTKVSTTTGAVSNSVLVKTVRLCEALSCSPGKTLAGNVREDSFMYGVMGTVVRYDDQNCTLYYRAGDDNSPLLSISIETLVKSLMDRSLVIMDENISVSLNWTDVFCYDDAEVLS